MNNHSFRTDWVHFAEVPYVEKLVSLAQNLDWLWVDFPVNIEVYSQEHIHQLVRELEECLPEYKVSISQRSPSVPNSHDSVPSPQVIYHLGMKRVITVQEVAANQNVLIHAMVQYRELANRLILQLALELGTAPTELATEYNWLQYKHGGTLQSEIAGEEWGYWFHGMDCEFVSKRRQRVWVALGKIEERGTDFGLLRPYPFLEFIKTTKEFTQVSKLLRGWEENICITFEVMEKRSVLRRVNGAENEWALAQNIHI